MTKIASRLARNKSSISREIKRGKVERINSDLTKSYVYRWDVAQRNYEKNKGGGGRYPRLHSAHPLLQSLQRLITINRLSPYAAVCVLQKQGHVPDFCVIPRLNAAVMRTQTGSSDASYLKEVPLMS